MNFKQDILEAVGTEKIAAVKILDGKIGSFSWPGEGDPRDISADKVGIVLTWEEAAPLLDYSFNAGYGTQDCHSILLWTKEHVYYIHEYDGSTSLDYVERNPS